MTAQGFSTNFEDHKGLLHMIARRCYGRANAAGIVIDYEDVYAEMCVAFMKASKGYDPSRGFAFTTYCGAICWHHFNKVMEKEERSGPKLKLLHLEDMGISNEEGGADVHHNGDDPLEFLEIEEDEDVEIGDSPEEIFERKRAFIDNFRKLSPVTRRYVAHMVGYRVDKDFNPSNEARAQIRRELQEVYGVTINKIRL